MKLASIFLTASAKYLRVYLKDMNKRASECQVSSSLLKQTTNFTLIHKKHHILWYNPYFFLILQIV